MPRKRCCGRIEDYPVGQRFISDHPGEQQTTTLGIEEVEALRLKDVSGFDQEACAQEMGLTRPTFQRILKTARKKVATALVEGHTIIIEGGNYTMKNRVFECVDCSEVWEVAPCSEGGKHGYEIACPKCGSMRKTKLVDGARHECGGHGHHEHGAQAGGCCGGN